MHAANTVHPVLVQPTPDTPWAVEVASFLPRNVVVVDENTNYLRRHAVTAAVAGRWHCICTKQHHHYHSKQQQQPLEKGDTIPLGGSSSFSYYYQLSVWYSTGTSTLPEQKHNRDVLTLRHDALHTTTSITMGDDGNEDDDSPPPLIALVTASYDETTAYVYAVNAVTGCLVLWKLQRSDLQRSPASGNKKPAAVTWIWGNTAVNDAPQHHHQRRVTVLNVEWKAGASFPMILVGTSASTTSSMDGASVYYVTQAHVPLTLRVIPAVPAASTTGLIRRLWNTVQYQEQQSAVACLLSLAPDDTFVSITETGKVLVWKVTPTESSAKALFGITSQLNLVESLRQHFAEKHDTVPPPLYEVTVLQAAIDASDGKLHVICLTQHADEEARLYWLCLHLDAVAATVTMPSAVWLNRFVAPESVVVLSLCVASNGIAYAALRQDPSLPNIVMAFDGSNSNNTLSEVDLPMPTVQSLLPNSMAADVVTHGVTVLDASGLGLRVRLVVPQQHHQTSPASGQVSAAVPTLTLHLRSTFAASYQNPDDRSVRLPPSLKTAAIADLEAAVTACAVQLLNDMSSSNALDLHLGFITMLQQSGIYRDVSMMCKWTLLSVGQKVCLLLALGDIRSQSTGWEEEQLKHLSPNNLSDWLVAVQTEVLAHGSGENRHEIWLQWLVAALDAANTFREERASVVYDVSPNQPPLANSPAEVPVWTSSPAVQAVLSKQLHYWRSTSTASASPEVIEAVIQYALLSCADSFLSCPGPETKEAYVIAQRSSFDILRKVKGMTGDNFIFELSMAHRDFNGLCQLALDHERRSDRASFALDPLFRQLALQDDVETGMKFGLYVLKWHTDRELFGHVLQYGKHCPDALNQLMNNIDALAPYRWIHATRQGDYNAATDSLFENATRPDTTLAGAKSALSMASIASSIVEQESVTLRHSAIKRRRLIDKKCEFVNAQKELMGNALTDNSRLWEPDRLLNYAIRKSEATEQRDDKVQALILALAVCTTFEDDEKIHEGALLVWFKAIVADATHWEGWLRNEPDLTDSMLRDLVLQNTVFGGLLQQSEDVDGWEDVTYNAIEADVFVRLGELYPLLLNGGMQRLLRSVTSEDHELSRGMSGEAGEAMMIS
jgi:hypothetical protein